MANILAVDDDAKMTRMISLCLTPQGHNIRTAHHGREALEILQEFDAQLIISDIIMPVMDGPSFVQQAWENAGGPHIPVIFLTGIITEDEERLQPSLGGKRFFLAKPFKPAKLQQLVAEALG